ncbi:hypothetical protein [Gynuella sunshinyii]|uniref:Uncharacterized protein n=1 Tax=Gynuella sunshinyii YC6258 TaxID=1445510 RepID=A0A0C5VTD3_9GAMM|nr:hypothetical protein [Gynuella sunshinyii]AJQ93574.1 hypothetical Protein YC6258_01526 [Gynuella sunshinyii YC6258]
MKKIIAPLFSLVLLTVAPSAFSTGWWGGGWGPGGWDWGDWNWECDNGWGQWGHDSCDDDSDQPPPATSVPEINANGAGLALALLGGVVLVARERKRNKN